MKTNATAYVLRRDDSHGTDRPLRLLIKQVSP